MKHALGQVGREGRFGVGRKAEIEPLGSRHQKRREAWAYVADTGTKGKQSPTSSTDTVLSSGLLKTLQGGFDLVHAPCDVRLTDGVGKSQVALTRRSKRTSWRAKNTIP